MHKAEAVKRQTSWDRESIRTCNSGYVFLYVDGCFQFHQGIENMAINYCISKKYNIVSIDDDYDDQ